MTAKLISCVLLISLEKPKVRCCSMTPGARMLKRTSLLGIGWPPCD